MSMELADKKVLVIGLGKTGMSTVDFLQRRGSRVVVTDERSALQLGETASRVEAMSVEMHLGGHDPAIVDGVDVIVPSPGVPPRNVLLCEGLKRNIPVLSELELACRFVREPIIAVTGTNGKTTTTELLGSIFRRCGRKAFVGGNLGTPFITAVDGSGSFDLHVVEVSSFQLQWVNSFRPAVAVLLNTSIDHIDYHGSFEEYCAVKERIFACQERDDLAILNAEEPQSQRIAGRLKSEVVLFSSVREVEEGIYADGEELRLTSGRGPEEIYSLDGTVLKGRHNRENAMAAVVAARRCGCPTDAVREALKEFRGIPHRIEAVGGRNGVEYYNDSKGTNIGAVARALETFERPVVLLMGGRYKGGRFSDLREAVTAKVKLLILFGEARETVAAELGDATASIQVAGMRDAVIKASEAAKAGDVVLLSPGCASFDEFSDYRERGDVFRQMVRDMTGSEDRG